ncbi:hypothetical protein B0H67DRAFT_643262 [Lasiosphaeris hirsuta]|uniref:Uncharacterized protein n=1 Tax=Lasiosphaeris hirsuta TaxID=260670 RepID=A0AA40AQ54_9PEZI|nr:hypothetical protein B0H67DRAFT_643262 [Lasiosphaeris hirsuta]
MAKDRARNPSVEPKAGKERKASKDKVSKSAKPKDIKDTKPKKDKKVKKLNEELVDDDATALQPVSSVAIEANDAEDYVAIDGDGDKKPQPGQLKVKAKKPKTPLNRETKKAEKAARKATVTESEKFVPVTTSSGNATDGKVGTAQEKKKSKQARKDAKLLEDKDQKPLFMIDTQPTKMVSKSDSNSESSSDSDSEEDQLKKRKMSKNAENNQNIKSAHGGLNRAARRHLLLMAREKEAIQKRLGIEPASKEPNKEVDHELSLWVARRAKVYTRTEDRFEERKEKKAVKKARAAQKKAELRKAKAAASTSK